MDNHCFYLLNNPVKFSTFYRDILCIRESVRQIDCTDVLLFHSDSYQFTVLFFALMLEGKHVLLPPNSQKRTLTQLSITCDITAGEILLDDKACIAFQSGYSTITQDVDCGFLFENINGKVTFFTSGSTGKPKEINKTFQQLLLEVEVLQSCFSSVLNISHLLLSTVSHQHIYGLLFKILLPLKSGLTIVNKTFEYPEHIKSYLSSIVIDTPDHTHKKIILISSPAHLKRLVSDNVLKPFAPFFSATFSSGGVLPLDSSQLYEAQMGKAAIEVYGSTETGGIAWREGQPQPDEPWRLFPKLTYEISNDNNRLLLCSPYIEEQPYLTDDRVDYVSQEMFILRGRVDRTVKIEEKRVSLDHIETCLAQHAWVNRAKVLMLTKEHNNHSRQVLVCVVSLNNQGMKTLSLQTKRYMNDAFKKHLLLDIERICLPKKWRYIDDFPYNAQGKLSLFELEKLFE